MYNSYKLNNIWNMRSIKKKFRNWFFINVLRNITTYSTLFPLNIFLYRFLFNSSVVGNFLTLRGDKSIENRKKSIEDKSNDYEAWWRTFISFFEHNSEITKAEWIGSSGTFIDQIRTHHFYVFYIFLIITCKTLI